MKWPGHAHILLTNVFHRSGTAPRRCIKLVFFIDLITPQNLDESKANTSDAAQVKPEVKHEVESAVKPDGESAVKPEVESSEVKPEGESAAKPEVESSAD